MKFKIGLSFLFVIAGLTISAQTFEKSGTISKSFEINEETEIQVINKYGNIQVVNWEKDSVHFDVAISVSGKKAYKVERNYNYIDIEFTGNRYYVIANTIFKDEKSNFWSDISEMANSLFNSGGNATIEITVYVPEQNPLKIKNKFGNVYLTNQTGQVDIELANGDLRANHLSGKSNIVLGFGKANIKKLDDAHLDINYGEVNIRQAGEIFIESRSSDFDIDEAREIKLKSGRGKFFLGDIERLNGEFSYSTIKIEMLELEVFLKSNFGSLMIENLNREINIYNINSTYTDISTVFNPSSNYKLELIYNKKTELLIPDNLKNTKEKVIDDDDNYYLSASSGEITVDSPTIKISQKGGSISIINQ